MMRIGIDLGGHKIEAIALDRHGNTLYRRRIDTPPEYHYPTTLAAIRDLVMDVETTTGQQGSLGIGIPGTLSPATGRVKNANSTYLIGTPLDTDLAALLERQVRVANDADCFTLSEAMDGAAAQARSVFGVILGSGVGGGLVYERRLIRGVNAIAGEWGHNPLPWPRDEERPGPACYCGRHGCLETFLSGPSMARDHGVHYGASPLTARDIATLAAEDDTNARATLDRYVDRLARGLATVINVFDPEAIVLGGGVSNVAQLYEALPARLPHYVFSDRVDTRILPPVHGDSSGVRGAAWLWDEATWR